MTIIASAFPDFSLKVIKSIVLLCKSTDEVDEEERVIEGRRISLLKIRKKTLDKQEEAGVIRPNSGIRRHLMFWSDHASILNNGHLLITVKVIYHPNVFFTDAEMESKGYKVYLNIVVACT